MLDVFREGAKTWASKILIWFVALTFVGTAFVVWGSGTSSPEGAAAVVKGESISKRQWGDRIRQVEDMFRKQLSGIDSAMLDSLNAPAVAMNSLIGIILQLQAAQNAGIVVTDVELSEAIRGMNEFYTAGSFDGRRYVEVLKRNGITPKKFEENVRADILVGKFKVVIDGDVQVSDLEAMNQYAYEHQQVVVEYVDVTKELMRTRVVVDEEKAKTWFEDKKNTFEEPEKREFKSVAIEFSKLAKKVEPTDAELEKYYAKNSLQFATHERVHARHILVKIDPAASDEEINEAMAKIKKASDRILIVGDDFADVAKEMSEGPSAESGGDLGTFKRGVMVPEFDKVIFGLEVGKLSDPFQTEFGLHIVEKLSHKKSSTPALDEVRHLVKEQVARNKAAVEGRKTLLQIRKRLAGGGDFDAILSAFAGVDVRDYSATKGIPVISFKYPGADVASVVFGLSDKGVSDILDLPEASFFLVLEAIQLPRVPSYDEVKAKVLTAYKGTLAFRLADEVALEIETGAKAGTDLNELATAQGLTVKTTKPFSRAERKKAGESARNIGMREEAFSLSVGESLASATSSGQVIFKVISRPVLNDEKIAKEMPVFREVLLNNKRARVYTEFLTNLRKEAETNGEIEILVDIDKRI